MIHKNFENENADNCSINIPTELPDLNEPPYRGSFQQLMKENIGRTVRIDFVAGASDNRSYTGIIEEVTNRYVVLKSLYNNTRFVGDNFNLRSITFLCD